MSGARMDTTGLRRQQTRLQRLKQRGITPSTVLVHDDCRPALDSLRPHLLDADHAGRLAALIEELHKKTGPTNIAKVRHLSPFRYPGGKTWLVPEVRQWLLCSKRRPSAFVEPFAGGAIAGLTVGAEDLADAVHLCELDSDVAAVWEAIFYGENADVEYLTASIASFDVTHENVRAIIDSKPRALRKRAFRTIIKNRMQRGGIMAAGAGLVKKGEAGRGLNSRWYPETLIKRIEALRGIRDRFTFHCGDAFEFVRTWADDPDAFFFVDPPYTAGGKRAGTRLYTHNAIDHEALFALMSSVNGSVMMTYDDAPEVHALAEQYGFRVERVPMKTTHHAVMHELLILKP